MEHSLQKARALAFRTLHHRQSLFILPNAWDVISARLFIEAGFPAIGTTSAGIAFSLGYPDGERLGRFEMIQVIKRLVHASNVPVNADIEAGYGRTPEEVAFTAQASILAGCAGVNIEDVLPGHNTLIDLSLQKEKIHALREVASNLDIPLVITARTDVFVLGKEQNIRCLPEAITRANEYIQAGADCVFLPGVSALPLLACLVREIHGPIGIVVAKDTPCVKDLASLGVARLSMGSGAMRASVALLCTIARELRDQGTYTHLLTNTIEYNDMYRFCSEPLRVDG